MLFFAFISLLFATNGRSEDLTLHNVRTLYGKATTEESDCEKLLRVLPPYEDTNDETLKAYRACATMLNAQYVWSPFTKMSYFKNGRNHLQKSVEADPDNVEIRYLRFTIQTESPAFLGYNEEISEDKNMLISSLNSLNDKELKKMIFDYLKSSDQLTKEEKQSLTL